MKFFGQVSALAWMMGAALLAAVGVPGASAQTLTTLWDSDGFPRGNLIADANGNLFGTTSGGGAYGWGTVFKIPKTAAGYATPTILASFDYFTHGAVLQAGLIADANGNLFGTTTQGGALDNGTVFKIAKTADGYASTPTVLAVSARLRRP